MAWETRRNGCRYYYRSVRVGGQVVKEYFGNGVAAQALARIDQTYAVEARLDRQARHRQRAEEAEIEAMMAELDEVCELLVRATMLAAGYHQHARGQWRKRRVQRVVPSPAPCPAASVPAIHPPARAAERNPSPSRKHQRRLSIGTYPPARTAERGPSWKPQRRFSSNSGPRASSGPPGTSPAWRCASRGCSAGGPKKRSRMLIRSRRCGHCCRPADEKASYFRSMSDCVLTTVCSSGNVWKDETSRHPDQVSTVTNPNGAMARRWFG
jgi:hypothetical protein